MESADMRFEKVREEKKDGKIHVLIDEFIKTNYDRVEVINEEDYFVSYVGESIICTLARKD